jgi:hypothetical protein
VTEPQRTVASARRLMDLIEGMDLKVGDEIHVNIDSTGMPVSVEKVEADDV